MPINACSINSFTINAFACSAQIPDVSLLGKKGHPYHQSINYAAYVERMRRRFEQEEDDEISVLDGPNIKIDIEMAGELYSQTLENDNGSITPMLVVSKLELVKDMPMEVHISNLSISGKKLSIKSDESK